MSGNVIRCHKCNTIMLAKHAQKCWWCMGDLCYACWDTVGHCDHPEAIAIMKQIQLAPSWEDRRNLVLTAIGDDAYCGKERRQEEAN